MTHFIPIPPHRVVHVRFTLIFPHVLSYPHCISTESNKYAHVHVLMFGLSQVSGFFSRSWSVVRWIHLHKVLAVICKQLATASSLMDCQLVRHSFIFILPFANTFNPKLPISTSIQSFLPHLFHLHPSLSVLLPNPLTQLDEFEFHFIFQSGCFSVVNT